MFKKQLSLILVVLMLITSIPSFAEGVDPVKAVRTTVIPVRLDRYMLTFFEELQLPLTGDLNTIEKVHYLNGGVWSELVLGVDFTLDVANSSLNLKSSFLSDKLPVSGLFDLRFSYTVTSGGGVSDLFSLDIVDSRNLRLLISDRVPSSIEVNMYSVSTDGTDVPVNVKWVTAEKKTAYLNTLELVSGMLPITSQTQEVIDTALSNLESAFTTLSPQFGTMLGTVNYATPWNSVKIINDYVNHLANISGRAISDNTGFSFTNRSTVEHLFEYLSITNVFDFYVQSPIDFKDSTGIKKRMNDFLTTNDVLVVKDLYNHIEVFSIVLVIVPSVNNLLESGFVEPDSQLEDGRVKFNFGFAYDSEEEAVPFKGVKLALYSKLLVGEYYQLTFIEYLEDILESDLVYNEALDFYYVSVQRTSSVPLENGLHFIEFTLINSSIPYAQDVNIEFDAETFAVTFVDAWNTVLKTEIVALEGNATPPTAPQRNGYTFIGWSQSYTNITSSRTLVPVYQAIQADDFYNPTIVVEQPKTPVNEIVVVIDGKTVVLGNETKTVEGGFSRLILNVNENIISSVTMGGSLDISLSSGSNSSVVSFSGKSVSELGDNESTINIQRDNVVYSIGADQLSHIVNDASLANSSVEFEVVINDLTTDEINKKIDSIKADGFSVVFSPVEFKVVAKVTDSNGIESELVVSKFTNYVERILAIPSDVDPSTITTGIVFNKDGSYSHVPTHVYQENGIWYARISSMTNSTYSVLGGKVVVDSAKGHWAEKTINNMASRQVLTNTENFNPDSNITREEFVEYLVKAIGVHRNDVDINILKFKDLRASNNLVPIANAVEWGLINGYNDHTFRPSATLTREEAIAMYSRAMDVIDFKRSSQVNLEAEFSDSADISVWAKIYVVRVTSEKIFNGKSKGILAPKDSLTHAEALAAIENLLINGGLINN